MTNQIRRPQNTELQSLPDRAPVACHIDAENICCKAAQFGLARIEEIAAVAHVLVTGRRESLQAYQALNDGRFYRFDEIAPGEKGSQRTDNAVATEATLSASYHRFSAVALFSSDGDFVECVSRLTRLNCYVIVVGEPHAPESLRKAASFFIEVSPASGAAALDQDVNSLIHTIESISRGEWLCLAWLGQQLRSVFRGLSYKDYGYKSLSDLLLDFPNRFEIRHVDYRVEVRSQRN